jgi:polysaccharide export outer membrane protein
MSQRKFCLLIALAASAAFVWCAEPPASKSYVLGPDDQVSVHVLDVDEIGPQSLRIDMQGNINLPLAGRIHAGGLTAEQLENEIARRLKGYLLNPTVSVSITEYHSQPISILGAVNKPGIHQLQGHKNLFEALSMAEGLRQDAGDEVKITRRLEWGAIPLPGAVNDPSGEYSVAKVSIKSIMEATDPQENVAMKPNDVLSVPKAKMVYVVGSVHRPGGFVLSEKETISVLQAVALAEGLEGTAASQKAVVMRAESGVAQRAEVPVDVSKILSGRSKDVSLQANDILFIPTNKAKTVAMRTIETLVQTGTGIVIYRR